jgi:rhomboid family GlyGly-CTERM serine protease
MKRRWLTLLLVSAASVLTALHLTGSDRWIERWLGCTRDGIAGAELWRLLSGPLVHASVGHALRDLVTLALLGLVWEGEGGRRYRLALLLGAALPPLAAFATRPTLRLYLGLSGAVYAALVAGLIWQWRRGPRLVVALGLVAVVVKVVVEVATGELLLPVGHPSGVAPVPMAHLAGLIGGASVTLWWREEPARRRFDRSTPPF